MVLDEKLIPEVYDQMERNHLIGDYYLDKPNHTIYWNISGYSIIIAQDYIGIKESGNSSKDIIHWHPDDDDILDEVLRIGTQGNITVIYTNMFREAVLYSGPQKECPPIRKRRWGKYHYIHAELI